MSGMLWAAGVRSYTHVAGQPWQVTWSAGPRALIACRPVRGPSPLQASPRRNGVNGLQWHYTLNQGMAGVGPPAGSCPQ
jgi:hypothetical protein